MSAEAVVHDIGGRRRLCLLGATGSIGDSTLDVVARHPDRFEVFAVAANRHWEKLLDICTRFRPRAAALLDPAAARSLERALRERDIGTEVLAGDAGLCAVASAAEADTVLAAIVGAAGLAPTLAAARAGKRILLANKEALVIGGAAFMSAVRESGAELLPIDSEHNAIFQCLPHAYRGDPPRRGIARIVLTASGGPFRTRNVSELEHVTPDEACAHPKWVMGRKISVDSATMMNKGLEVIEAHWLFDAPPERIDVVIHPESVIHSLVEYVDGSMLAQLGNPDMRTPIAHALAYPDRVESGVTRLDLAALKGLHFETADPVRFPCLALAYEALRTGGTAPAVLNAANEVAVASFLEGTLRYVDIPAACTHALEALAAVPIHDLEDALRADAQARVLARDWIARAAARKAVA